MEERAQRNARVIYNKGEREESDGEKNRQRKKSRKVREPNSVEATHFACSVCRPFYFSL